VKRNYVIEVPVSLYFLFQEAWWLKRACHRSRCRIIAECAEAFGIVVPSMRDIHAHNSESVHMAIPTIDTVEYDICLSKDEQSVQVFDACTNINCIRNGFLASMHPSEGFWIFKGIHDRSRGSNAYGVTWHTQSSMPAAIPSCVIKVPMRTTSKIQEKANEKARKLRYATVLTKDSNAIVRINMVPNMLGSNMLENTSGKECMPSNECVLTPASTARMHPKHEQHQAKECEPTAEKEQLYQFFDEAYLQQIAHLGWHRDMGIVELIPIVVGVSVI
jgi:hypothetical protein